MNINREEERQALAKILELAKNHRDLSDTSQEQRRWSEVVGLAYEALGRPNLEKLGAIQRKEKPP